MVFGFLGKVVKTTLDVALVPVAVVQDVVTLGGELNDKGETYTGEKLRHIGEDIEEVRDEF